MSNEYEGRDTLVEEEAPARRAEDAPRKKHGRVKHKRFSDHVQPKLPPVELDDMGIPTFVFKEKLSAAERPTATERTLEVTMLWRDAVISVGHFGVGQSANMGDHVDVTFRVAAEGLPTDNYPLIVADGNDHLITWTNPMKVELRQNDGPKLSAEQLEKKGNVRTATLNGVTQYLYKLGNEDRLAVQFGDVTFVVHYVSPSKVVTGGFGKGLDYYFTKVMSLSLMLHLFVVLAVLFTPVDPNAVEDDLFKNANRFAKLILKEQEKPKEQKKFELSGSKGGGRHKDEEGKFGKPNKDQKDALASTKGAPVVDPNKREKDRQIALNSGIFSVIGGKGGAVSDVFGPGGLGTGINNALGGLRGTAMGDAGGAGGLGTRGTGPGGGGNSLGIGGLGNGTGRGTGGLGNVDLGGRGKGDYSVTVGRTITKGCLNQQVVLRVLSRVQSQAKYCYEKELTRDPNLAGKITTQFTINATGSVSTASVSDSTMGSPPVEDCLVKVIKRLMFPPCAGGGTAEITYPWIFKSGGG